MLSPCGKSVKFVIFDWPEMNYVQAKVYLAGHLDRRTPKNYFEPWITSPNKLKGHKEGHS